ncbi:MAG TPA: hypothetical protein VK857_06120 [Desulforhopalus sp.]|jgi:hypothetical protein|nr:hypothetical protein [Desulforhopalus sp.]
MNQLEHILNSLEPEEAIRQTAAALKQLLPLLGEESRTGFIIELIGESGKDKISSMVHL